MKRRRISWEERKKQKEVVRKISHSHLFPNDILTKKARLVAEYLLTLNFVREVGLFGSASRGESGYDVDLVIIDDGTISTSAFLQLKKSNSSGEGFSGGTYAEICYGFLHNFANRLPSDFFRFSMESPYAIDLVFLRADIRTNQSYLDELILNGNDAYFFRNISKDILCYDASEGRFKRDARFSTFVNGGVPSAHILKKIEEEQALYEYSAPMGVSVGETQAGVSVVASQERASFDLIGGQHGAKAEIMNLSSALNNPLAYERWGTKPPRGVCLFGPPGNGKTLLAKALAAETGANFYPVDASQISSMFWGEAEKNVDRIFEQARKTGGVIFFDEADSLAQSRDGWGADSVVKRIIGALCRNMDGFNSSDKVVVFFATNRPEDMDSAVMRPGRIDRIIEVPLPDRKGRQEIFSIRMREAEKIAGKPLFKEIDLGVILEKTEGFSGADIAEIIRRTLEAKVREEANGTIPHPVSSADILMEISDYERTKKIRNKIGF